jgi:hypothetical protein
MGSACVSHCLYRYFKRFSLLFLQLNRSLSGLQACPRSKRGSHRAVTHGCAAYGGWWSKPSHRESSSRFPLQLEYTHLPQLQPYRCLVPSGPRCYPCYGKPVIQATLFELALWLLDIRHQTTALDFPLDERAHRAVFRDS